MKKFYTFAFFASTILCANAGYPVASQRISLAENENSDLFCATYAAASDAIDMPVAKAPEANATLNDFVGVYEWNYYGFLSNDEGSKSSQLRIEVMDEATGAVLLLGWPLNFGVKAFIDIEAGTLSIPNKQPLGRDMQGDPAYFYLKEMYDGVGQLPGVSDAEYTVGQIDGTTITFPRYDLWTIGNYKDESGGYVMMRAVNRLTLKPGIDNNTGWEDFGTATFEDGWIPLRKDVFPQECPWQVKVQKNTEEDGLYRLQSPYLEADCPVPGVAEGYIVFSIADPDFVVVYPDVYSGYNNVTSKQNDMMYLFNLEGFYMMQTGNTKEEILKNFPIRTEEDKKQQALTGNIKGVDSFSFYRDGVATIHNCCFDVQVPAKQRYTWSSKTYGSHMFNMISKITIDRLVPSSVIDEVYMYDGDGQAEYFTLQGMRISEPVSGQVVIRRIGNKVTKVIVK